MPAPLGTKQWYHYVFVQVKDKAEFIVAVTEATNQASPKHAQLTYEDAKALIPAGYLTTHTSKDVLMDMSGCWPYMRCSTAS